MPRRTLTDAGERFRCFGHTVMVEADRDLLTSLRQLAPKEIWPVCEDPPERRWRLRRDGDQVCLYGFEPCGTARQDRFDDAITALEALRSQIELWAAAQADVVVIHAAVVAVESVGVVIPGPSHSGKTVFALELVDAGAIYFSDEFALLGTDGTVGPYARPIAVRSPGGGRDHLQLTEAPPRAPIGVGLIASLPYDPALVGALNYREVESSQGVLLLIGNAVAARTQPFPVLDACTAAASRAKVIDGRRGDARFAATELVAAIRSRRL